ncbi:MAG: Dabb family protein [bacterium]|nr:Dabb family protein [bacterium]
MKSQNKSCILLFFSCLLLLTGCVSTHNSNSGSAHHLVLCWLKTPGDQGAKAELIRVSNGFVDIPGVLSVSAGSAIPSDRPIVDSSFDVAILIVLENESALRKYLEHPDHKAAQANTLRPLVDRVLVYDFTVGSSGPD